MVAERERHRPGEVLDGTNLLEDLFKAGLLWEVLATELTLGLDAGTPLLVAKQPVELVGLQGKEAGNLKWFLDAGERDAMWTRSDS